MNSLLSYKSCCYEWESRESHKNVVKEKNSGQIYGAISKDTSTSLRKKFKTLILAQPIVSIFLRMPYRVYTILRGDCIRVGYKAATKEWQIQTQKWSLELDPKISPPNRLNFCVSVGKHTFIELIKSISKVVTYPLAIIALEFSLLYGLINPNNGRAMYAAVEHAWSSTQLDEISQSGQFRELELKIGHYIQDTIPLYFLCDYLAPCMQPKEIWDQRNFYKMWESYNPNTIRSLLREAKEKVREKQEFYENEGILVQAFISTLQWYQQNVNRISSDDNKERNERGHFQSQIQEDIAHSLIQLIKALNEIEEFREVRFLDQVSTWNQSKDKSTEQNCINILGKIQNINNSLYSKFR